MDEPETGVGRFLHTAEENETKNLDATRLTRRFPCDTFIACSRQLFVVVAPISSSRASDRN
jgi:hypothetical protein